MASRKSLTALPTGLSYLNRQQYFAECRLGIKLINRSLRCAKSLYCKDLYAHYGCVNAIEFSEDGEWLVSGGDDKRVLIWNLDKTLSGCHQPKAMKGEHNSNIFCLGFSTSHHKLYSAGNDEQVILHDVPTGETLDVFLHDEAVYGLSVDPYNESLFATACDDGRILIWDVREPTHDAFMLAGCTSAFHAVMHNPQDSRLLATANAKEGVALWDIRAPREMVMKYGGVLLNQSAMSVRFNSTGTQLLALRRRLPPVLFEVDSPYVYAEFDHPEYYNSCTMKSCCFAGDKDEYALSGSDDFKLYAWKIPERMSSESGRLINEAHLVLRGHRSIVNQVRYNNVYGMLASSGVEKIIKMWSTFSLTHKEDVNDYISKKDALRKVYTHEEYINLVLESGQFMTHDYSHHSVQEDPRMMAFFDSLVQRDIEGWTSDSSDTSSAALKRNTCFEVQSSASPASSQSSSEDEEPERKQREAKSKDKKSNLRQLEHSRVNAAKASTNPGDNEDTSMDRISQLIAKKRREQLLKSKRAYLKLRRKKYKLKKNSEWTNGSSANTTENPESVENSALNSVFKNKIKLLRKKRAEINKNLRLDEQSSDSDNEELNSSVKNHKQTTENPKLSSGENNPSASGGGGAVNGKLDNSGEQTVEPSNPNSSNNDSNAAVAASSNSVAFQPRNLRLNGRNYRKRHAQDD